MVAMMELLLFGVLLQMFQLCYVDADGDDDDFDEDNGLTAVPIVILVIALFVGLLLSIWVWYWRCTRRNTVEITVQGTVPVIIRGSNPNHAGYNQGKIQPTSPPALRGGNATNYGSSARSYRYS